MIDKIKELLIPYHYSNLKRYGGNHDGGYILAEDLLEKSDIIYSYGVGPSEGWITFDRHMLAMNKKVYMYDNLINGFWTSHPNLVFKSEYVNSQNILQHIYENKHENNTNMILKMDIEGNEFETLINSSTELFTYFNQIAIEIHDLTNNHSEPQYLINADNEHERWMNKIRLFSKLNEYFYLVHIHGNNYSDKVIHGVADVLELLYVRKDCIGDGVCVSNERCPRYALDFPNDVYKPEIVMDWWLK